MFFRGPNLAHEMGGNTSKRVQAFFVFCPYSSSFRVSWPFLATCGLTHIRVNMLQNPPISCQNLHPKRKKQAYRLSFNTRGYRGTGYVLLPVRGQPVPLCI